jgi:hypothetical protein
MKGHQYLHEYNRDLGLYMHKECYRLSLKRDDPATGRYFVRDCNRRLAAPSR